MSGSGKTSLQWAEFVTTVGVLVSLVFVGLEIRQNTAVARSQARSELATMDQAWLLSFAQDSLLQKTFSDYWNPRDDREFTYVQERQMIGAMVAYLRRLENAHLFAQEGLIPESALEEGYGIQTPYWLQPRFKDEFWPRARSGFDPVFVEFFERQVGL